MNNEEKLSTCMVFRDRMITMLKENGGLLFTTLLIGIALGIGGTLLVQHIRRKKKQ